MRVISKWLVWGALSGAALVSGCASQANAEAAEAAQAGLTQDPDAAHLRFIRNALSKVTLRADQQSVVNALTQEAEARHANVHQARLALRGALADQVQAGKIDRAALKPSQDALLAAIEQTRSLDRAALVRLHDTFDKNQRNQFVDALEAEFRGHGGGPGHAGGPGERLRQWGTDLNLTKAQREEIGAGIRAKFDQQGGPQGMAKEHWRAAREHGHQLLESFRQDQFAPDANGPMGTDQIGRGIDRMITLAEVAVPVLTPEQRAIAAQKVRSEPLHH
jgi:hypothetical protein